MIGGVRILTRQTTRWLCRTFFPVIIFSSCNWCVCILTWQTVIWDLFQPLVRRLYLFFFRAVIFSGGSENIAGQTTVPSFFFRSYFFWVIIGICILTRAPIMVLTYDRKQLLTRKKGLSEIYSNQWPDDCTFFFRS